MTARLAALAALLALVAGCSKPERVDAPEGTPVHLGDDWFAFRAASASREGAVPHEATPDDIAAATSAARARDAAIAGDTPPASLDRSVLVEASAVYRKVCAECHGADGTPPDPMPDGGKRPRAWGGTGTRMGFFFGGDSMRRGIWRTIRKGSEPEAEGKAPRMPAWQTKLSREQTWGLVRYLESL